MDDLAVAERNVLAAEEKLLQFPQVDCPVEHFFAPGVYIRQITMPAGSMVIGHMHKTEHPNVILRGSALVSIDGRVEKITAGMTFISGCGVRKVLLVIEEMVWQTTHVIDTSDIPNVSQLTLEEQEELVNKLAPTLIRPSQGWEKRRLEYEMQKLTTKEVTCLGQQ